MTRHVALLALALLLAPGCKNEEPAPADGATPPASQPTEPAQPVPAGLEAFAPIVGKTPAEAEEWLKQHPTASAEHPDTPVVVVRPVKVDGEELARTMDMRNDRVNVVVEQGVITGVDGVY